MAITCDQVLKMWSKHSHYQIIVCVLVQIFVILPETLTQSIKVPQSPCPGVFRYSSRENYYFGSGILTDVPIGTNVHLKANVIFEAKRNGTVGGRFQLYGSETDNVDNINKKQPISFIILFPDQKALPLISSIIMNKRVICKGPSASEYKNGTHITYNLTIRSDMTHSSQPTLMPRPTTTIASVENFNISCGKIPKLFTSLAFGGTTIDKGEWPWLVAIHTFQKSSLSFRCGGTIISNTAVLSAAHCFYIRQFKIQAEDITIFLGHHNLRHLQEDGSRIINVDSIIIHPEYNPDSKFFSDIAIAKFPTAVKYSDFIQPVCLWNGSQDKSQIVGQVGSLVGWGRDEYGNLFTAEPKRVQVPIVSDEVCLRSHEAFRKITNENTFCGGWRNGTDGPCTGDSGTGLMIHKGGVWYIRGIVSSSISDPATLSCDLYEYVSFTDVAMFTDWIQSEMS